MLLAALFHKSPGPGALLMKHFLAFVPAYRESLAASSSVIHGIVNAAANINHCLASVKLWLLLERMLSQIPEASIPKAMPFTIWNALWTPISDLIVVYEADVSRGQDMVRATSHIFSEQPVLPKSQDTVERHGVGHCGPFPILERVSFSFGIGNRGARGHPQSSWQVRSTRQLRHQGGSSEFFFVTLLPANTYNIVGTDAADDSRTNTKGSVDRTACSGQGRRDCRGEDRIAGSQ